MTTSIVNVDYTEESSNKVLTSDSLVEAIHEYFDPTTDHDPEYLMKRIELLRDFFEVGVGSENPNSRVIEDLLFGHGSLCALQVLPFDGAIEVPNGLETETHVEINLKFESSLEKLRLEFWQIQHEYLRSLVRKSIPESKRSTNTTLGKLIEDGLPASDPGSDPMDF
jgi:hypothetical protein